MWVKRFDMLRNLCSTVVMVLALAGGLQAGENWPEFRGPTGEGHADAASLPLQWSEKQNIRWKTPIHDRGWSSPVVHGKHIWLTTATADGHELYALHLDRDTGKVLHDLHLFHIDKPQICHAFNSFASPSPAIEEGRVYVHFGSPGTACLDSATGEVLWKRGDLICDHFRGAGSSPYIYGDLLILTMDGIDVQYLIALDKHTGKTVWKTDRTTKFTSDNGDFRKAYTTPTLATIAGKPAIISPGSDSAFAYDPLTGKEIWQVRYKGYSNASRTVILDDVAFINIGFNRPEIWAVRIQGSGDITDTHVLWKMPRGVPRKPSPLIIDGLLYVLDDKGIIACLDPKTGNDIWRERIPGNYSASLLHAAGRIYAFSEDGTGTVLAPGREFKVLAQNKLDDGFLASPAVVGKSLIVRSKTHVYRIEE